MKKEASLFCDIRQADNQCARDKLVSTLLGSVTGSRVAFESPERIPLYPNNPTPFASLR